MKLDKVSTYLDSETFSATFNLPSATVTIKKKETVAGCGVRGARHSIADFRLRISDWKDFNDGVRGAGNELRPRKFQAPKNKSQINPNDQNSKFETTELVAGQTKRLPIVGPNGMINAGPEYPKRWDTASVRVSVIDYWKLRFIWYLVLEIWNFIYL